MFDEPKDMFAETERPEAQGASQAPTPTPIPAPPIAPPPSNLPTDSGMLPPEPPLPSPHTGGALRVVIIVLVLLVVAGVSGFFAYRIMTQPSSAGLVDSVPDTGVVDKTPDAVPEEEDVAPVPQETQTVNPATLLDSDGDGLSNARELEMQTSVSKADTDGDGLGDREEVDVYGTDPRDPDTDGDGFLDGQEVSSGYNPNGDGKLFAVPSGS